MIGRNLLIALIGCLLAIAADAKPKAVAAPEKGKPPSTEAKSQHTKVVMAIVGGTEITVEQFMQYLAKNPRRVKEAVEPRGKAGLLRDLIANALLIQAMRKEGLVTEKSTQQEMLQAYSQFAAKHFPAPPAPGEQELLAYYEANKYAFGIPPMVRISDIQFSYDPDSPTGEQDKAAAKARADAALARLKQGEAFGTVAESTTEAASGKSTQGDRGFVAPQREPWLNDAIKGLKKGDHTGVLASRSGYHILMLTDQRPGLSTPFPEVRDRITKIMRNEKQTQARLAYVKQLAADTPIEIVLDELKGEFSNGIFP